MHDEPSSGEKSHGGGKDEEHHEAGEQRAALKSGHGLAEAVKNLSKKNELQHTLGGAN